MRAVAAHHAVIQCVAFARLRMSIPHGPGNAAHGLHTGAAYRAFSCDLRRTACHLVHLHVRLAVERDGDFPAPCQGVHRPPIRTRRHIST